MRVVTLTKAGHRLLKKSNQLPDDQPIYHGLVKPREVKHDADLYRLYQKEAARIERSGGRPVRVLLDYELKRNLNRDLALAGTGKRRSGAQARNRRKAQLQVVNGKIPIPDLRVEYESPNTSCAMWTWNWRHVTTGREPWPRKPPQGSRFTAVQKTHHGCAASSTNVKSRQGYSRYEYYTSSSRCSKSPRLHRSRSPISLYRSDAFRLLRCAPISGLHGRPLGQPHDHFLEQTATNKHARTDCFPKSGTVYHFFSRRLYRQIERENIRNRRKHEIDFIKRRIAMLDFVLLNPGYQYLETEPEKSASSRGT